MESSRKRCERVSAALLGLYIEHLEGRNRDLERNLQSFLGGQNASQDVNENHVDSAAETLSAASVNQSTFSKRVPSISRRDLRESQPPQNPIPPQRVGGGSSSGAAAAGVLDENPLQGVDTATPTLPDSTLPNQTVHDNVANPPSGWVENDDSGNVSDEVKDERDLGEPGSTTHPGYFGESSMVAFMSTVRSTESGNRPSPSVRSSRPSDGSPPVSSVQRLARYTSGRELDDCLALPQRYVADRLVNAYFTYIDSILPFIHEPSFRAKYDRTWQPLGDNSGPEDVQDLSWLALLNLVFAFGSEYADSSPRGAGCLSSSRFFKRSTTILFSQVFHSANLETIQTLLLTSHYLQGTNNLNKCWSVVGLCIRLAHGMGLHLDPSRWHISHIEQEFRRRLWWGCYVVDCMLSLRYGRPPSDLDKTSDVRLPQLIDGEYLRDKAAESRQPDGQPARCHSLLVDISLSRNIAAIVRELYLECYPSNGSHIVDNGGDDSSKLRSDGRFLSTVVRLDCGLVDWHQTLPAHLRPDAKNSDWKLQRQANILYTKYVTIRVMLHRKSFVAFRHNQPQEDFQQALIISSVRQCMNNARELINFLDGLHKSKTVNMWWTDAQYLYMSVAALVGCRAMESARRIAISGLDNLESEDKSIKLGISLLREIGRRSSMIHRYAENLQQLFEDTIAQERHGAGTSRASQDEDTVPTTRPQTAGAAPSRGQQSSTSSRGQGGQRTLNGPHSLFSGNSNDAADAGGGAPPSGAPHPLPEMPLQGDLFFMEGLDGFGDQSMGSIGVEYSTMGQPYPTSDIFNGGGFGSLDSMEYDTFRMG
ncbi:Fungal specific transcription factor domain-containing protein [Cladophialophora immunda]|nr:Fungal specific transcription factor domain-containing protein [Cladophialophora immunda]